MLLMGYWIDLNFKLENRAANLLSLFQYFQDGSPVIVGR